MPESLDRLTEQLKDRYAVEREIGAGGMATVFLARDLRHQRPVALKVIRPEVSGGSGIDRFLQEIQLAARLQHPHILAVFDSGAIEDAAGRMPYFVMPFVEGETLRARLQRETRLPVDDAVRIAGEVADALAYAHQHGVVHRDIKPENILLSGGHAIVADFGVAKALEAGAESPVAPGAPGTRLTVAGLTVGTPHYMSPEQATAQDVDARSDQYSLGSVLYEMLTGTPPFEGPTPQSVVAKSLSAPRPKPSRVRGEIPAELDQVVTRAMALDPAQRFPDMAAFGSALRAAGGKTARLSRRATLLIAAVALVVAAAFAGSRLMTHASTHMVEQDAETIAVLPFSASGPGTEMMGEGMVDLLSTNLQGVGGIKTVDPRAVLKRYADSKLAGAGGLDRALEVGRKVRAASVVMGSAVSTGGRVRLAADLYSVAGERIARAQVDGSSDSMLAMVDRLSVTLLRDVWRSREPMPSIRIAALTTDSIEALRAFLQGEQYYRRFVLDSALAAYTHATEVDSTFALAHLRRALVIGWTGGYGSPASTEAATAAVRFAGRLPARDRRLLAGYHMFDQGKPPAVDSLRAFVAAYPDDIEGWYMYGEALYHLREFRPVSPDTIMAAFDMVLRADSSLIPAVIHPIELSLLYRDTTKLAKYQRIWERYATPPRETVDLARKVMLGQVPRDSALAVAMGANPGPFAYALTSYYRREDATSDTIVRAWNRLGPLFPTPKSGSAHASALQSVIPRAYSLVGFGRLNEALALYDSVVAFNPRAGMGLIGWPVALGIAPRGWQEEKVGRVLAKLPPGPEAEYAHAMRDLIQGQVAQGRRRIAAALAVHDTSARATGFRGRLIGADGWAMLLQGDTLAGIRRLRAGIDTAAAPKAGASTGFMRFQLALALAARPETRPEGIRWLEYAFDAQPPEIMPLTFLALGRAYEEAGSRDSAAYAYGRFIRLWDKADPPLQGRVREAKEALARMTAEPRQ